MQEKDQLFPLRSVGNKFDQDQEVKCQVMQYKGDKIQGRRLSGFSYVTMKDWCLHGIQCNMLNLCYFYAYYQTD